MNRIDHWIESGDGQEDDDELYDALEEAADRLDAKGMDEWFALAGWQPGDPPLISSYRPPAYTLDDD